VSDDAKLSPFLSTRECADLIAVSPDFIVAAIKDGALKAGRLQRGPSSRVIYRVHEEDFLGWLKASGWSTLPARRLA
jgi:excisionase family DNA binding protein